MKALFHSVMAALTVVSLASCDLPPVTVAVDGDTVVEGNSVVAIFNQLGFDQLTEFDITSSAEFQNKVGSLSKVDSIYLDSFKLSAVAPDSGSIDFIHSGYFEMQAEGKGSVIIAELPYRPAEGAKSIALSANKKDDLKPIIASKQFTLVSQLAGTPPDQDTQVRANLVFLIYLN